MCIEILVSVKENEAVLISGKGKKNKKYRVVVRIIQYYIN